MSSIPDHLVPSRLARRSHSIPTTFMRCADKIFIHGSVSSHFIREIEKGIPVCISVTLVDLKQRHSHFPQAKLLQRSVLVCR
jgi:hypothetical protein